MELKLFKITFFPYRKKVRKKGFRAIVGIGGNIGKIFFMYKKLFRFFLEHKRVKVISTSPILKNPPFGYKQQPDFFNAVIEVETKLGLRDFFKLLMFVEKQFGRKRSFKNAPRKIDLDLIFFDKIIADFKFIKVPHPFWQKRISVIVPLRFINSLEKNYKKWYNYIS